METVTRPSETAVRAALADLRPGTTVRDLATVEAGKNAVYAVTFADREAILKVGTASPDRVRAEPAILRFVRDRTGVPVPAVLAVSDDVLEHPCCLFERVAGRTVPDRPTDLSSDVLARLCEDGGRHLAALHEVDSFETVGPLVPGDDGVAVRGSYEDWPSLLERAMTAKIEALGGRFDRYEATLQDYVASAVDEHRRSASVDPVLVHMDYRPANLVFDPDEPFRTRAVLDWAGAAAAPAAYEIAHAEALLTDWPRLGAADRADLRVRFRSGYAPEVDVPEIPTLYRVDARLRLMKHLDLEVDESDESAREARAAEHVRSLAALGVLSEP
ncbi:phosphotransferase [Halostella sp. JP-L12]|uniref:phosphotransferase family protein n=1 Tax=Halostella TaxID=1843185 RepID=UPI0013CE56AB|nr:MULTISPECIES: phosphotransferase [Halostella]NHN46591.1 phosphotransferase [Halostella sp. JP-L12]